MNLGIDLGTTFSAVAYIDKNNRPQIIPNTDGEHITPSVIMEDDDHSIIVGTVAKDNAIIRRDAVIATFKDHMGTQYRYMLPSGRSLSPEECSAMILKKIVRDAESQLGERAENVVITIPAYFTDAQRKATEDAAHMAGLNVSATINEPTAAALYFAHENDITDATVLVYDLGGGTFDVSIVCISKDSVEVRATGGIRKMGGHFFDQIILNYVTDHLLDQHDIDLYDDEYLDDLQELLQKAEKCKLQLSGKAKAVIPIKIGKVREQLEITREQFESMMEKFYLRTESTIQMVLDDAGYDWNNIDKILLVGGSSRIPMIRERLAALSGKTPSAELNPDEAVALGAAIFGHNDRKEVRDVCSHSLGIVTVDAQDKRRKNDIIIPRNSVLPTHREKEFYTAADNAPFIRLEVTEGEDEDLEYVNIIGTFDIDLPPGTPKYSRVSVEMALKENQLLHIYAHVFGTRETYKEIHIERSGNLKEEDIAQMTVLLSNTNIQ